MICSQIFAWVKGPYFKYFVYFIKLMFMFSQDITTFFFSLNFTQLSISLTVVVFHSSVSLCNPMDFSMPGFPVFHYLPEFAQAHGHWVSDAIQPSHPLWSPSPPAFNLSQHQGLFQWVCSLHQVAKGLVLDYSGLISRRIDSLDLLAVLATLMSVL